MRRLHLSTLLISLNVGLVLLAMLGIASIASGLLQQFADEQALERMTQTATIARQVLVRSGAEVTSSAQLLAERPTLARLVATDDQAALAEFLDQFRATSHLAGALVLREDRVIASSGVALPAALRQRVTAQPQFLLPLGAAAPLILGATVPAAAPERTTIIVFIQLDQTYEQQLSLAVGLSARIIERTAAEAAASLPQAAIRRQALSTNATQSARLDALGQYVAFEPLADPSGAVVGVIEVTKPTDRIIAAVRRLSTTLLLAALVVGGVATVINLLVGRRVGAPLRTLTRAAARIGQGDLSTPVVSAGGAEISTLASTLEDMRQRLGLLTANLRRQQAEANAILTGIVEGVFTVDRDRRIRYLNPQAAALLGIAPEQALGRFCGDVLYPHESGGARPCEEHCPIIHARFRGGARATEHLLLESGERRTVIITSAGMAESQQVQVLRDETEVEATRRLRDTILANISHEFRTPLSAQLASIELLLDQLESLSTTQIGQLVVALQRGTLRLTYLIDNLLESARIEAGNLAIRRRPLALDAVVEEALDMLQPLIDQRDQHVAVDLPYPLPLVSGDRPRLIQVFVNVLANSSKFAPAGSTIRIGGAVSATALTIWVEDAGPGLPAFAAESLFSRFVRAPAAEPEQSGVGLGLWIVQSIIERHGGTVQARSLAVGTRVEVALPLNGGENPRE